MMQPAEKNDSAEVGRMFPMMFYITLLIFHLAIQLIV